MASLLWPKQKLSQVFFFKKNPLIRSPLLYRFAWPIGDKEYCGFCIDKIVSPGYPKDFFAVTIVCWNISQVNSFKTKYYVSIFVGFELDSEAALSYLLSRTDIDTNKIVIFGRSLGGAVAIALASNELYVDKAYALIVENTFTSIPCMANQLVNGLGRLPYFCFRNKVIKVMSTSKLNHECFHIERHKTSTNWWKYNNIVVNIHHWHLTNNLSLNLTNGLLTDRLNLTNNRWT